MEILYWIVLVTLSFIYGQTIAKVCCNYSWKIGIAQFVIFIAVAYLVYHRGF